MTNHCAVDLKLYNQGTDETILDRFLRKNRKNLMLAAKRPETIALFMLDDGRIIHQVKDAYLTGINKHKFYSAPAYFSTEDFAHSATIEIIWDALNDDEDESNRCNWDKPTSIIHYALGDLI